MSELGCGFECGEPACFCQDDMLELRKQYDKENLEKKKNTKIEPKKVDWPEYY